MCITAVSGNLPLISCTGEEPQFQERATIKHLSRSWGSRMMVEDRVLGLFIQALPLARLLLPVKSHTVLESSRSLRERRGKRNGYKRFYRRKALPCKIKFTLDPQ